MNSFGLPDNFHSMGVRSSVTQRGTVVFNNGASYAIQAHPTDPIGTFTITLTNLVPSSHIQIQATDGTALYNDTAASSTKVINLQAYTAGSPLNDLVIKVRKGSESPYFQPWSTQATAIKGSQTIFVSQIKDE